MKTVIRRAAMALGAFVGAGSLFADTFVWTGAEDAYWTNKANWQVEKSGGGGEWEAASRCPGALVSTNLTASFENLDADTGDAASFGAAGAARTTIDLDGLFAVRSITIDGATAKYTFGTAGQDLTLTKDGTFTLTADAGFAPAFGGAVLVGTGQTTPAWGGWQYPKTTFQNDSTLEFVLPSIARGPTRSAEASEKFFIASPTLAGTGPFRLAGDGSSSVVRFYFSNYGKTTIAANIACYGYETSVVNKDYSALDFEILEDCSFGMYDGDDRAIINQARKLNVTGAGTYGLVGDAGAATYLKINQRPLSLASGFTVTNGNLWLLANRNDDVCTINFLPGVDNQMTGGIVWGNSPFVISTPSIGANGEKSALGSGSILQFAWGGRLVYNGTGETTTRTISISNGNSTTGKAQGVLAHEGTGDWTVDSVFVPSYVATAVSPMLTLENSTDCALTVNSVISNGVTALAFAKTGSGLVVLGGSNTFSGAASVSGGTLRFAATGSADDAASWTLSDGAAIEFAATSAPVTKTLNAISVDSSPVTVSVGENVTVSLGAVPTAADGGSLDILLADGAKLVCAAAAGTSVPYTTLRVNHQPAAFDANGVLKKGAYVPGGSVDVRGGIITNDSTATVGFVDAGESGNVTLGLTATAVDVLVQDLEEDAATVEFKSGETLTANTLVLKEGATNLTVGADRTTGSFVVPTAGLLLDNASTNGELAVRAPLSYTGTAYLNKLGDGLAEVPGAAALTARATVYGGTLAYAFDETTRLETAKPAASESATYSVANTTSKMTLTPSADGLELAGTTTTSHPLSLSVPVGTSVRVTGSNTVLQASGIAIGSAEGAGELSVAGGATVVYDVNNILVSGDLTITNATVQLGTYSSTGSEKNTVILGRAVASGVYVPGRLTIEAESAFTGPVAVGYRAPGAMIVNGGWAFCSRPNRSTIIGETDNSGKNPVDGYVRVNGGELDFQIYIYGKFGNFDVKAGTVDLGNSWSIAPNAGNAFHFRMTGGTCLATNNVGLVCGNGDGVFTLDGPTAVYSRPGNYRGHNHAPSAGYRTIINLNAGDYRHHRIGKAGGAEGKVYVNMNGGKISMSESGDTSPLDAALDRATVYENGITFSTIKSYTRANYCDKPLLSAPGKGVTGVVGFVPLTDRLLPPCAIVEGDGEGASAAPEFDEKTGTVTGIRITSRGWNYTWAKVHLFTHDFTVTTNATFVCELAENRRGGMTYDPLYSNQEFDLKATNDLAYVTLKKGTLKPMVAGAISPGMDVIIEDGILQLAVASNELVFASISGTNGTVRAPRWNSKFEIVTANPGTGLTGVKFVRSDAWAAVLPVHQTCTGAWNLSAADIAAGKTVKVMDEVVFGAGSTLTITGDLSILDKSKRYAIFEATKGSFEGQPGVTTRGWRVRTVGGKLMLVAVKGTAIILK